MTLALKMIVMLILFLPALVLTGIIWIFGGWTKGFSYMPNPVFSLLDWVQG